MNTLLKKLFNQEEYRAGRFKNNFYLIKLSDIHYIEQHLEDEEDLDDFYSENGFVPIKITEFEYNSLKEYNYVI